MSRFRTNLTLSIFATVSLFAISAMASAITPPKEKMQPEIREPMKSSKPSGRRAIPPPTLDTNGDGKMDAWDRDSDGRADAWDTDGDGRPDAVDNDGDGKPDDRKETPPEEAEQPNG